LSPQIEIYTGEFFFQLPSNSAKKYAQSIVNRPNMEKDVGNVGQPRDDDFLEP